MAEEKTTDGPPADTPGTPAVVEEGTAVDTAEEEEEEDDGVFKLHVKGGGKAALLPLDPAAPLSDIKAQVRTEFGMPDDERLVLVKDGAALEEKEGSTLASLGFESRDTLELKHQLHRTWTMWYDTPDPTKKPDPTNWHANIKKIICFDTVEDFWGLFNNLMTPSRLKDKSNYHFFRDGIMPAWEDPQNTKGGKWVLQLNTNAGDKKLLDEVWLFTILEFIGEGFEDSDEICGVVVSLRKSRNRIAIWTRDASNSEAMKRLGQKFKEKMNLGARYKISFTSHADSATARNPKVLHEY